MTGNTQRYPLIEVVSGDITKVPSDAIITAINSGGMWFGGIDGAIQRAAGDLYHRQAAARMPLNNLDVIVATGNRSQHHGQFDNVVFVVDDLQTPLREVIYTGLEAAHNAGYESITIPTLRMGVMAGVYEKSPQATVAQMETGVVGFQQVFGRRTNLKKATFVVYNDPNAQKLLKNRFAV